MQSFESFTKLQLEKGGPHPNHWQAMWLWIFKIFVQVNLIFFPGFCKILFSEMKPEDMDWSDFIFNQSETNPCVSAIVFLTLIRYFS